MLSSQRIFVDAIRKYCLIHDIAIEVRSDGWLIVLRRGNRRHLAFAYDIGLNSATARQIANDKAATAEILKLSGVPCIPHTLFLGPKLAAYAPASGSWKRCFVCSTNIRQDLSSSRTRERQATASSW